MKLKNLLLLFLFVGLAQGVAIAQVTTDPAQPTADAPVEIIYNAAQGTSGLVGATTVYMHSSIGTDGTGAHWADNYTVGTWGADDGVGQMTKRDDLGANMWSITITPKDYYNIPDGVIAYNLAMVFRNADGTAEGKNDSNSDIFIELFPDGTEIRITNPTGEPLITTSGTQIVVEAKAGEVVDSLKLFENGNLLNHVTDTDTISSSFTPNADGAGEIVALLFQGSTVESDTFDYFVRPASSVIEDLPAGLTKGVNYISDDSVVLVLFAPLKDVVFVISDLTDYKLDINYMCKKSSDNHFWLPIGGLNEKQEYGYQYFIDDGIVVGDPYSEKILDPDDQWIPEDVYPNLKEYPYDKTEGPVSIFEINRDEYVWQTTGYVRPPKEELVIYELLVRDFSDNDSYQTVIDSLNYLDSLGINAIQLMPVMEFKGNDSWGYNPTFFMAADKAYGPREKLKEFIDKCHARGIAVILDIALNHAHEWFPYCAMWFDTDGVFQPAPENPFYNPQAKHPFNVFFDMNHEAEVSQEYVDAVNKYWVEEYRVDGYRFDLSKGFTQRQSGDVGAWNAYDQSRVDLLNRMANKLWEVDPDVYVILEHLGDNDEEKVLANAGMMLWGIMHNPFKENILGFSNATANVNWANYQEREFNDPNLVVYMESHDEERQMVDALNFGNSSGNYNVRDPKTAYERIAAANALMYAIPGPKMLWQFAEVGYDFSINYCINDGTINQDCRVGRKPIRWDYFDDADRRELYNTMAEIIKLKTAYDIFNTEDVFISDENGVDLAKFVKLTHQPYTANPTSADEMNMIVLVNLDVQERVLRPIFHHTGEWYDHFTDEVLNIAEQNETVTLAPGEFKIYTDFDLPSVKFNGPTALENELLKASIKMFPNPTSGRLNMTMSNELRGDVQMRIISVLGTELLTKSFEKSGVSLSHTFDITTLPAGLYILQVQTEDGNASKTFIKE
ncbi:MAG: alpha-amylase family glycosyl hydrolase [Flammeovirgaceae bacterium]